MIKIKKTIAVTMFVFFFLQTFFLPAGKRQKIKTAPLNPAFVKYMSDIKSGKYPLVSRGGHFFGYIPPTVSLDHVQGNVVSAVESTYPASYDLRDYGKVTPVKEQGDCGSCWAFATYGSLESFLKTGESRDFSENHLITNHGFAPGPCAGGNAIISTAYLARWTGPVNEADDPYPYTSESGVLGQDVQKHVQQVIFLPKRSSHLDNGTIKYHISNFGAVYAAFFWNDINYNTNNKSYYKDRLISGDGGHAVTIVGWNDNYSKTMFNALPPYDGAFIVKNSWGTDWGNNGYFYISYCDISIRDFVAFNSAEPAGNYEKIFQYDPYGMEVHKGFGSTTAWGANIFTADDNMHVKAVSFYTNDSNVHYTAYLYRNVAAGGNPRAGELAASKSGDIAYPGYHTVSFAEPALIVENDRFSVVIKLVNSGYQYPLPVETQLPNNTPYASADPGESFVSSDGEADNWADLTDTDPNANLCIKAFADTAGPSITVTTPAGGEVFNTGETIDINWLTELIDGDIDIILRREDLSYTYDVVLNHPHDASPYNFTIPAAVPPGNYHVLIRKIVSGGDNVYGRSQGEFAIVTPTLTVVSPNGGELWPSGSVQDISWSSTGNVGAVRIEYSIDNGGVYQEIIAATANDGHFAWTVPFTFSDTCRVRISEAVDGAPLDTGDGVFAIHGPDYIAAGTTLSFTNGLRDMLLYRINDNGTKQWRQNFGGSGDDYGRSVQQTADGGFVLAGYSDSDFGGGYNLGGYDFLLYRLDAAGNVQWWKNYGGSGDDYGYSVSQTTDGGFVLAGYSDSDFGGGYNLGGYDFVVYRLDSSGTKLWRKNLGGTGNDYCYSVQPTSDGGYILVGKSDSFTYGGFDFLVYKLDSSGDEEWWNHFGGSGDDWGYSVQQTSDGGYVLAGETTSFSYGGVDYLLYKLDSSGTKQWRQNFGGSGNDYGCSVRQTFDGGYVLAGYSDSDFGGGYNLGGYDFVLYKLDGSGTKQWRKNFGGGGDDYGYAVRPCVDGGYILVGKSDSFTYGGVDFLLYKLDSSGTEQWSQHFGGNEDDDGRCVQEIN